MIGLFADDTTRLAVTYNGLTLNNPADSSDETYELNAVVSHPQHDAIEDPSLDDDGSEAYKVRKVKLLVVIDGTVRSRTIAGFYDKVKALAKTFDPARVSHDNPTVNGFLALAFSVPTLDTTNYSNGLVPSKYLARARAITLPPDSTTSGYAGFFRLEMECVDPRRYWQTTTTSSANPTSLTNSLADYRSFPTVTITMAGAGSATHTITRTVSGYTTKALVLNLSALVNTDVVVVDMGAHSITTNGASTPGLYVSGSWFELEPAVNAIAITNGTNASDVFSWTRAFSI